MRANPSGLSTFRKVSNFLNMQINYPAKPSLSHEGWIPVSKFKIEVAKRDKYAFVESEFCGVINGREGLH
jgi:hypothetical protein